MAERNYLFNTEHAYLHHVPVNKNRWGWWWGGVLPKEILSIIHQMFLSSHPFSLSLHKFKIEMSFRGKELAKG